MLDEVFDSDDNTWLSVTSHSGEIASILRGMYSSCLRIKWRLTIRLVLGHQVFSLSTGAVIPVFIKAETVSGTPASTAELPYTTISTCSTQPALATPTS